MTPQGLVVAPSHDAQREQRYAQDEGKYADDDPDIDQTDAHPYWIGGRSKPTPRSHVPCAVGGCARSGAFEAARMSRPNAPTTRVQNR
jgi:hypothetical protein